MKTIRCLGVDIPVEKFHDSYKWTVKDVLDIESADCRAAVIRDLYEEGNLGFFRDLLKEGKGELVLTPTSPNDYQYGRLFQVEFEGVLNKYLEVINRTPEPWAVDLTPAERMERGLTKEGYKTVLLGVDPTIQYESIWHAWFWTFGIDAKTPEEAADKCGFDLTQINFIET